MTIKEVQEFGNFSFSNFFTNVFTHKETLLYLSLGVLGTTLLFIILTYIANKKMMRISAIITNLIFLLFAFTIVIGFIKESQLKDTWKKEYLIPYINSLPDEQYEIKQIKQIDRLFNKNSEEELEIRTRNREVAKSYKFTYMKDEYAYELLESASVRYTDVEKPMLVAKFVKEDLNEDYQKGAYKIEILVPKDYKIKN